MQTEKWNAVAQTVNVNLEIEIPEFARLVPKDTSILDYGCGYGRNCRKLMSIGYSNIIGCIITKYGC